MTGRQKIAVWTALVVVIDGVVLLAVFLAWRGGW